MEEDELIFFSECLNSCETYLEFGGGGSTYMACGNIRYKLNDVLHLNDINPLANVSPYVTEEKNRVKKIYSIEHDKEWVERTKFCIGVDFGEEVLEKLEMYHVPINDTDSKSTYINEDSERGEVGEALEYDWGHCNNSKGLSHIKYQSFIYEVDKKVDLILVDGRYRAATALNCIKWCHFNSPNTKILIHDFGPKPGEDHNWRPQYNIVENFLNIEKSVQNLYLFTLKDSKSWTYKDLYAAIESSKNDPT